MPYGLRLELAVTSTGLFRVPGHDEPRMIVPPLLELSPIPFPWRGEDFDEPRVGPGGMRQVPAAFEEAAVRLPLLARVDDYGLTAFEGDELGQLAQELVEAEAIVGESDGACLGIAGRAVARLRPHVARAVFHGI